MLCWAHSTRCTSADSRLSRSKAGTSCQRPLGLQDQAWDGKGWQFEHTLQRNANRELCKPWESVVLHNSDRTFARPDNFEENAGPLLSEDIFPQQPSKATDPETGDARPCLVQDPGRTAASKMPNFVQHFMRDVFPGNIVVAGARLAGLLSRLAPRFNGIWPDHGTVSQQSQLLISLVPRLGGPKPAAFVQNIIFWKSASIKVGQYPEGHV